MKDLDLWPLIFQTFDPFTAHYGPAIDRAAAELGIPVGEWYGWLMAARIFEPDPISTARLQVRGPYTAPWKHDAALAKGASLGLLTPVGPGEYRLTEAGRAGVQHLIETAYAAMTPLQPLPQPDLLRLAGLLQRVVEASLAAPEPPGKWCLRIARHYDPGADAPVMVRLDQYLSDLNAYRDDAHLAAWRPLGISGPAWESFTLLWRGEVTTLDELCERLSRRGFTRDEYASALGQLADRGWIAAVGGRYSLTGSGLSAREDAEALTDRYFYTPWDCLTPSESEEVGDLLGKFAKALAPVAA